MKPKPLRLVSDSASGSGKLFYEIIPLQTSKTSMEFTVSLWGTSRLLVFHLVSEYSCSVSQYKCRVCCTDDCLSSLYVIAFTSGVLSAGSNDGHAVELRTATETRRVRLYDRPGDDYYIHKGDLWKIPIGEFYFTDGCITVSELRGIALTEHSNDGWHIESVVTFLRAGDAYQLYTEDFEANQWIDGDGHFSFRRFDLNIVI